MERQELEKRKNLISELLESELYVPMKEKELAVMMQVAQQDRKDFKQALEEMLQEGRVQLTKRGRYTKPEKQVLTGRFVGNQKGFGFVEIEGEEQDLYVSESHVNGAMHGDTVQVTLLPGQKGRRQEAQVCAVVERATTQLVGTWQSGKSYGFVIPDNSKFTNDIFVQTERSKGAVNGHKVIVEITDYGRPGKNPEGKIIEILGHVNDPGVDIMSMIKGYDLPVEFPERVMNQAERMPDSVGEADLAGRLDLRDMQMVTIDGEDAKDLDDAVSLSEEGGFYQLGVHIADVSNYVQENSALDREALKRATSVYLVDRVIPMLPHKLSNGICSLNAGEDRLALSCLMSIDKKGNVKDYKIAETVIRVDRRMSYTSVAKILEEQDEAECREYAELVPMFERMEKLAGLLRKKRQQRGSVDFDFPESKILLDKEGHPVEIRPYDRNKATKIIEDFMLIANETVAQHFYWMEIPFLYRTHDTPDEEKLEKLALFIHNFGYTLKLGREEIHPKEFQKLLGRIEGSPEEALISRLTLRSMKQAKYTVECSGHFGLACPYYCHFTSPIRRYPDLQIHRIIKEQLRGRLQEKRTEHYQAVLTEVARHCSEMERRADEAERETDKLKKAEYMQGHIGEEFDGVISGVTSWGVYVELNNTVEGMIHVAALPGDYFVYDENACEMVGQDTGVVYKLGQRLRIVVKDADKITRTIDFSVAEDSEITEEQAKKGRKESKRHGKGSNEAGGQ